ncbi:MAG: DUF1015 family protein [Methanoregula sp.]|nr:MAG: DUF1015 family protein [Methanoregula sp.]
MVRIYRFAGVRPERSAAPAIAAVPYDVVTVDEARAIIEKDPQSFLRVSRSDAELPGIPPYDDRVYKRARDNFLGYLKDGSMQKDTAPGMYLYRVRNANETFLGLCCCLDVDDYRTNHIRRHEQTRYDKEEDRTRHIEVTRTHNGPVVLLYRDTGGVFSFIDSLVSDGRVPEAELRTYNGAIHQMYRISDPSSLNNLEMLFARVPDLYIADGHHRAKSAVNVADRNPNADKDAEINRFMGVLFAHDRVRIHGYSRLLTDLGSFTPQSFLAGLAEFFDIQPYENVDDLGYNIQPRTKDTDKFHVMHIYLKGQWYECVRNISPTAPALESLDVVVLQKYVLKDMLGITDPRGDSRLQYLGGARPIRDIEQMVDCGEYMTAFVMQPVKVDTVLAIADAHGIMPPKSTWFEPKLMSGLVVHTFE